MSIRRAALIRLAIAVVLVAGVGVTGYIVTVKIADYQREQYFEVRKFQAAAAAAGLEATDVEAAARSSPWRFPGADEWHPLRVLLTEATGLPIMSLTTKGARLRRRQQRKVV
jgi:hypothetical protein